MINHSKQASRLSLFLLLIFSSSYSFADISGKGNPPPVCTKPLDPMTATQSLSINNATTTANSTLDDVSILGGERDMKLEKLQSDALLNANFYVGDGGSGNGSIDITNGTGDFSKATIVWDGNDNDANTLNPNGLGGVDLSSGDAFGLLVNAVDVERFKITLRLYSGASNVSEAVFAYDNQQAGTTTNIPVNFTLATVSGSGADLAHVGAVELIFEPIDLDLTANGIDLNLGKFTAPCPVIPPNIDLNLTKTVDKPTAHRGDTLVYTLTLTNTSAVNATGVEVTDMLPNGVSYVSDDAAIQGMTYNATSGVWLVGQVNANATKTLKITATIR